MTNRNTFRTSPDDVRQQALAAVKTGEKRVTIGVGPQAKKATRRIERDDDGNVTITVTDDDGKVLRTERITGSSDDAAKANSLLREQGTIKTGEAFKATPVAGRGATGQPGRPQKEVREQTLTKAGIEKALEGVQAGGGRQTQALRESFPEAFAAAKGERDRLLDSLPKTSDGGVDLDRALRNGDLTADQAKGLFGDEQTAAALGRVSAQQEITERGFDLDGDTFDLVQAREEGISQATLIEAGFRPGDVARAEQQRREQAPRGTTPTAEDFERDMPGETLEEAIGTQFTIAEGERDLRPFATPEQQEEFQREQVLDRLEPYSSITGPEGGAGRRERVFDAGLALAEGAVTPQEVGRVFGEEGASAAQERADQLQRAAQQGYYATGGLLPDELQQAIRDRIEEKRAALEQQRAIPGRSRVEAVSLNLESDIRDLQAFLAQGGLLPDIEVRLLNRDVAELRRQQQNIEALRERSDDATPEFLSTLNEEERRIQQQLADREGDLRDAVTRAELDPISNQRSDSILTELDRFIRAAPDEATRIALREAALLAGTTVVGTLALRPIAAGARAGLTAARGAGRRAGDAITTAAARAAGIPRSQARLLPTAQRLRLAVADEQGFIRLSGTDAATSQELSRRAQTQINAAIVRAERQASGGRTVQERLAAARPIGQQPGGAAQTSGLSREAQIGRELRRQIREGGELRRDLEAIRVQNAAGQTVGLSESQIAALAAVAASGAAADRNLATQATAAESQAPLPQQETRTTTATDDFVDEPEADLEPALEFEAPSIYPAELGTPSIVPDDFFEEEASLGTQPEEDIDTAEDVSVDEGLAEDLEPADDVDDEISAGTAVETGAAAEEDVAAEEEVATGTATQTQTQGTVATDASLSEQTSTGTRARAATQASLAQQVAAASLAAQQVATTNAGSPVDPRMTTAQRQKEEEPAARIPRQPSRPVTARLPKFNLPGDTELPEGVFPKLVRWQQGFTEITFNLQTGKPVHQRKMNTNGDPDSSFRVLNTSRVPPSDRRHEMGVFDVVITRAGLEFQRAKPQVKKPRPPRPRNPFRAKMGR